MATRKVQSLLDCGAFVTVIAPQISLLLQELHNQGLIQWEKRSFCPEDLQGMFLVVAATDDLQVNEAVAFAAGEQGALVNVVDKPVLCDFILPAVSREGGLVMTASTEGRSPLLAASLLREMSRMYGKRYGELAEFCGSLRPLVMSEPDRRKRQLFWQILLRAPFPGDLSPEELVVEIWRQVEVELEN